MKKFLPIVMALIVGLVACTEPEENIPPAVQKPDTEQSEKPDPGDNPGNQGSGNENQGGGNQGNENQGGENTGGDNPGNEDQKDPDFPDGPDTPDADINLSKVFAQNRYGIYDQATATFTLTLPTEALFKEVEVIFTMKAQELWFNGEKINTKAVVDLSKPATVIVRSGEFKKTYTLVAKNTGLPILKIDTPNKAAITSKETWVEGADMRLFLADGTLDYEGTMSIKGRGNSTWNYPKKPYAIKLDSKAKILGMPKHKRWILLANWKDRTLLRNDAAFWLSRHTQALPYTVRGQFVELELNGKHRGNYYLCEQIKIDPNRVNINKMPDLTTDPEEFTGGFIMELDTYYDEPLRFHSSVYHLPYQFKDPDEDALSQEAVNYFKGFITDLENLFKDTQRVQNHEYEEFFDVDTSIDFMFVEELATNTDFYNYWPSEGSHSVYLYKEKDGKLFSGPVWDFDYHGFLPSLASQWAGANKATYYPRLVKDSKYRDRMLEKWGQEKDTFLGLTEYIDQMADYIRESEKINHELWPINNNENGDENMSFQQAVDRIKEGFTKKHSWMNSHLKDLK